MNDTANGLRRFEHADLRTRNSFGIAARAPLLVEVGDPAALPLALSWTGPAAMVLGGGSNLLFAADPPEPLIALTCDAISIVDDDGENVRVRAQAGADWHSFVLWTLEHGLSGLQNLALIPGTVGAAPIQNIGAYGVEAGDSIHAVEVYDRTAGGFVRLDRERCAFAYRDSLFKRRPDAYIVTAVEFALSRRPRLSLDYAGLGDELAAMGVASPTPMQVADAVVRIRRRKLPDPAVVGNAGSFFKNPIVPAADAADLQSAYPTLPMFRGDRDGTRKLSAAWLIDQCGWKGHRDGDAGVSAQHALVLVNHGHAAGGELLALARRIAASVQARFGVAIEPEPRIVGARW